MEELMRSELLVLEMQVEAVVAEHWQMAVAGAGVVVQLSWEAPELELVVEEQAYCLAAAATVHSVQEPLQVMEEQLTLEAAVEGEQRSC